MAFWTTGAVGLVIAYLFGSTPTGYLAGKLLKGIDIREHVGPDITDCDGESADRTEAGRTRGAAHKGQFLHPDRQLAQEPKLMAVAEARS